MMVKRAFYGSLLLALVLTGSAFAQSAPSASWAVRASSDYRVTANLTYFVASNQELKLDVYQRTGVTSPQPTLIFFHGGFWAGGAKESSLMSIIPWLEMGWNVVNVEYRLARVALAPAAVEDCFCALRFLATEAKTYNIDLTRLVVTGESAGGHLSLVTGMIPASEGMDRQCATATPVPNVAAVINWYGVTDVGDVIDGPNFRPRAMQWMANLTNRQELSRRLSPLTYVRAGLPPIMSVHGDADPTVPYQHAVRLHAALSKVGARNELLTIPGGRHGNFTPEERAKIYAGIREFLAKNALGGTRTN